MACTELWYYQKDKWPGRIEAYKKQWKLFLLDLAWREE